MKVPPVILRSCFTCDTHGKILTVVKDDFGIFTNAIRPGSFSQLFAANAVDIAHQFWNVLLDQSNVFSFGIPVAFPSLKGTGKFTGVVGSTEIAIIVSNEAAEELSGRSNSASNNGTS